MHPNNVTIKNPHFIAPFRRPFDSNSVNRRAKIEQKMTMYIMSLIIVNKYESYPPQNSQLGLLVLLLRYSIVL